MGVTTALKGWPVSLLSRQNQAQCSQEHTCPLRPTSQTVPELSSRPLATRLRKQRPELGGQRSCITPFHAEGHVPGRGRANRPHVVRGLLPPGAVCWGQRQTILGVFPEVSSAEYEQLYTKGLLWYWETPSLTKLSRIVITGFLRTNQHGEHSLRS